MLFDRRAFTYQPESATFLCPAWQTLAREQLSRKDRTVYYAACVRNLRAQIAMRDEFPSHGLTASARRGATAHAKTSHAAGYATTPIRCGTSVCESEIPHLRASTLPVARTARSTNRNQPGGSRLQPETDAEYRRRAKAICSPAGHLIPLSAEVTRRPGECNSEK